MFAGCLFFICGANVDEKVVRGRSTTVWKGFFFIRYCNLRLLQGRGQRWLLFTPFFMARKIIDTQSPPGSHGGRDGLCGT